MITAALESPSTTRAPDGFWRRFRRDHWESAPLACPAPWTARLFSREAAFAALADAGAARRAGHDRPKVRLFVGGAQVADPTPWLPNARDRSYERYIDRVLVRARRDPFMMVVNNVQMASFPFYRRLRTFLGGLYAEAGIPPYLVDASFFLGNYDANEFGIHQDDVSVLMLVLDGQKTLYTWPEHELDANVIVQHRKRPQRLYPSARALVGTPGTIAYWPAGAWHIGKSHGLSLSLNISLGATGADREHTGSPGTPSEILEGAVRSILQGADPTLLEYPEMVSPRRGRRAGGADRARRLLRRQIATGALERELARWTLKRRSAFGFNGAPFPGPRVRPARAEVVQADAGATFEWKRVRDTLLVAAHGHVESFPWSRGLVQALRRLARGTPVPVATLLDSVPSAERPALYALLEHLCTVRGLRRTSPTSSLLWAASSASRWAGRRRRAGR